MNRKNEYKDMEKFKKTKREQQYRYKHRLGAGMYKPRKWEKWEDELVLKHENPDRELVEVLQRSIGAIVVRRVRLKKWQESQLQ